MHDSAVAERPARARGRASSTSSSIGAPRARTDTARAAPRAPPRARRPRASAPGSTKRSTWISKSRAQIVASTPSPSPPASASARATADSLAEEAQHAPLRRRARASTRRTGSVSSARGQSRCSSRGGPGSARRRTPPRLQRRAPAPCRRARARPRPPGSVACFARPAAKSAYGRRSRSATARDHASICASSSSSSDEPAPGRAREQLDGAVVVGRPEPAGDEHRSARARRASACSSSSASSPTIAISSRLEPSETQRLREERPVEVAAVAADELAARDDERARAAQPTCQRRRRDDEHAAAGRRRACTRLPFDRDARFSGVLDVEPEALARERLASRPARACPGRRPRRSAPPRRIATVRRAVGARDRELAAGGGGAACFVAVRASGVGGFAARVAAARLPRADHERPSRPRSPRARPATTATRRAGVRRCGRARGARGASLVLADDVARVVLVDVELPVEAEVVGVRAQEALDVRLGREQLELLLLEGAQVLAADLRRLLDLREVEPGRRRASRRLLPISNTRRRV